MALCHKCLFYGFVVWFLHEIQASEYNKNEWNTKLYRDNTKYITIACRKKHLLTDIEVVAGKETFDLKSQTLIDMYGKTPYLLKEVLLCYWKKVCRLGFPNDRMVKCVTLNSTESNGVAVQENEEFSPLSCLLHEVEFIRPIRANCIRKEDLKNLCERKKGKLNCKTKFREKKGMIKSHESFPWYYGYQNLTHKFNFSLPKKKSLIIFISFAHVCEDDVLTLRTSRRDINIANKEDNFQLIFTKREHKFVELKFIAAPDSKPRRCGGGFLICYRGRKHNIEDILYTIRAVSVSYCLTAIACTGSGVFTLWYAAPDINFPYSSASGVWTGIFTFIIFVLGLTTVKNYDANNPTSTRCKIITYYTFIIMDISYGITHVTFSAIGFSYCHSEMRTGGIHCNAEERPRLLLMEGFSIAFGIAITLLSFGATVYLSLGRKINVLAGMTTEDDHFTCCNGNCRRNTGCAY